MTTSKPLRFSVAKAGLLLLLLMWGFCVFSFSTCFIPTTGGRPLPTWAQGMFAFCFIVLAPLVGILNTFQRGEKAFNTQKCIVVVDLALLVSAVIAILLFPDYLQISMIPEHLIVLFTLPALLAGFGVLWVGRSTRKQTALLASIILFVYLAGALLSYGLFTRPQRMALPWSATQVQEYLWQDSFLPDFEYCLKAKISEGDFENYVDHYNLTHPIEGHVIGGGCSAEWWDISMGYGAYGKVEGDREMLATYKNGFIYVVSSER